MALQILPILLLGGGAAVIYTKQKEKQRKKSGAACPPVTTVTIGELATVAAQMAEKFKNAKSPYGEVNYGLNQLLPKGCNKNSKNSRIKIQLTAEGEEIDFDISVPDFYVMAVSNSVATRAEKGMITQEQAQAYQAKALEWYKKATGTVFDPSSLGLEKLARALGDAMQEAIGGKKLKPSKPAKCPPKVVVDIEGHRQEVVQFVGAALAQGEKNPFALAEHVFNKVVPEPCTKRDFTTMAEVHLKYETKELDLAAVYAAIVLDILEEMVRRNLLGEMDVMNTFRQLADNYKMLTGRDLPKNLI